MELAEKCARDGNVNAISDAMTASQLAHAAVTSAGYNVRINLNSLEEEAASKKMLQELADLEQTADGRKRDSRSHAGTGRAFLAGFSRPGLRAS